MNAKEGLCSVYTGTMIRCCGTDDQIKRNMHFFEKIIDVAKLMNN